MTPHWRSLLIRSDHLMLYYKHSHSVTVLIKLSNTQSSVLLLSEVGLCLWARGRDSGCWVRWSVKEKGWGREEMVWARTCSFCENHKSDITTFPPEKRKDTGCPGFFGSHFHAVDTENILMTLFTRINRNHRDPEDRASQIICNHNS